MTIDPKTLAETVAPLRPSLTNILTNEAIDLIVAALRAYEPPPPHIHTWSHWYWTGDWYSRACTTCLQGQEHADHLVAATGRPRKEAAP